MARKLAENLVSWAEKKQSRRGFLAWAGKMGLALGAASAGITLVPRKAWAACCTGTVCDSIGFTCVSTSACPSGCNGNGTTLCCDTQTNVCHYCNSCSCNHTACYCETVEGSTCGTGPC